MTKKKRAQAIGGSADATATVLQDLKIGAPGISSPSSPKAPEYSSSALIICRNKHWRYISSFHGPWLQLPPEVLESLAYSNYGSPRPHPIDPAVFFDLVKVRRLVEEATNLAVRATNGTTLSALSNSLYAGNGIFGGGGTAALGLGIGGGGANAKLSRERKHRMRELATQKLSEAYALDEIATSVATMQSASSIENVAKLVLQRNEKDADAKYVHFFHEKIPSRMLAQCTSLVPLNDVIHDRPTDGALLRTRAVTRIFKDDLSGAVKDLTEALAVCRLMQAEHERGRGQLQLADSLGGAEGRYGHGENPRTDTIMEDDNQPMSLELQLLFHRAGAYLTRACQHIGTALGGIASGGQSVAMDLRDSSEAKPPPASAEQNANEARKHVKAYAKRALRDYLSFLSNFDYSPGLPNETTEAYCRGANTATASTNRTGRVSRDRLLEMSGNSKLRYGTLSDALVQTAERIERTHTNGPSSYVKPEVRPPLPVSTVYAVSHLFSSSPPDDIPPYPGNSQDIGLRGQANSQSSSVETYNKLLANPMYHEAVTYHPLLTDALHSVLLCHSLIQTSAKEHLRHAHMVARLARVCDGYPIFLAARSPSRADWIEVIRRADNWINLQQSWEFLCAPAPLPVQTSPAKEETREGERVRERRKQEAIMEALADERVHDEASFQAAVAARERLTDARSIEEQRPDGNSPKRWAQSDGKDYLISTDRADAIARWIRDAPCGSEARDKSKQNSKKTRVSHLVATVESDSLSELRAEALQFDEISLASVSS
ncbi:hypothetical protein MMC13_004540 [Lambiella insularis]|nr:hypothetical protein [Lambiella insularis]